MKGKNNPKWNGCGQLSGTYFHQIRKNARNRKIKFDITIDYIWCLYLEQQGRCALSNRLIEVTSSTELKQGKMTASLDRINSKKGYIKGNVQWIHKIYSTMKWNHPEKIAFKAMAQLVDYQRSIGNL